MPLTNEYYLGYLDAILYSQADQDVESKANERPTIHVRLPDETMNGEPFDVQQLARVLAEYDDAGLVYLRVYRRSSRTMKISNTVWHDDRIEVAHTEGWQGLPDDFRHFESGVTDQRNT